MLILSGSPPTPQIRTFSIPLWIGLNTPCTKDKTIFFLGRDVPDIMQYEFPNPPDALLPIQKLLIQAKEWRQWIDDGKMNQTQIAQKEGVSKARVTQILSLFTFVSRGARVGYVAEIRLKLARGVLQSEH